jgi:hypothetical protein
MTAIIVSIAAFSIFGAGWATPARADGGSGTVPGVGGGGGSNNNSSSGPNGPTAAGGCGVGAQTFTVTGPEKVTQLLDVGIGSAMFLSDVGGLGTGAIRPLFVPITSMTVDLIPATLLQPNPAGWTDLGCGITTSGKVSDGQAVTYILQGQQVCFDLAVGAAAAYKNLRIAYFDNRLARWVFLQTTVSNTQACHASFRLAPTTFALFGGA